VPRINVLLDETGPKHDRGDSDKKVPGSLVNPAPRHCEFIDVPGLFALCKKQQHNIL